MRVVHLNTYLYGGAGHCALGLHGALRTLGLDSTLLARDLAGAEGATLVPGRAAHERWWKWLERHCIRRNRTPISNTGFSIGYPACEIVPRPEIQAANVLHLHWVTEFLSTPVLAALASLGKPMVWTLHDQRPLTGGCHYAAGCEGYTRDCHPCPQLQDDPWGLPSANLRDALELLPGAEITVVTPSQWLAGCARRSRLFRDARIEVIPNGIDPQVFQPVDRAAARRRWGWPEKAVVIGCNIDGSRQRRKGVAELREALQILLSDPATPPGVRVACYGRGTGGLEVLGERLLPPLGYLQSAPELAMTYAALDVFVQPSLEDNFPTTVLEALACGVPVAAFETGGIGELVRDGITGRLAPVGKAAALAGALRELISDPARMAEYGATGAKTVAENYTVQLQAERHARLYATLGSRTPRPLALARIGPHMQRIVRGLAREAFRRSLRHQADFLRMVCRGVARRLNPRCP